MRNFMEAYGAVHNTEAKEEFYSKRDELSEMDFTLINQDELDDIAEEALQELFDEGYTVAEAEAVFEEVITEATVTFGHDTESPRAKKMKAMKSSLKGAIGKVKGKAASSAVSGYAAYRGAKQAAQDKARKTAQTAKNVSAQTSRKVGDAKAKIKSGLKGMIKKAAGKVAKGATAVAKRMSEQTVSKNKMEGWESAYNAIYDKKADKDYDGDGKIESGTDEYMGSRDKAIKKAMGKKDCPKCGGKGCSHCEGKGTHSEGYGTGAAMIRGGGKPKKKVDVFAYDRKIGKKTTPDGKPLPPAPKNEGVQFSEAELAKFEEIVNSWDD